MKPTEAIQDSVLIVEDHADTAEMLRRLLVRNGFKADVANSAGEAIEMMDRQRPTCLILDETMPGMTGLDLMRHMSNDPQHREIPVLFYSAAFDAQKQATAKALGARGWFIKGVSRLPDLVDEVKATRGN
jgi:CheY-like chemotaxis protein